MMSIAGDSVVFEGCGANSVLGLDDGMPRPVTVTGPYSFTVDADTHDAAAPSAAAPAGYVRTVRESARVLCSS
jgi:hypothetical protein